MNYYLKILNEVRSGSILKVDGSSGLLYLFKWDGKIRAYIYHPKKQEEVDDLFRTMGRTTAYIFCPVDIPGNSIPPPPSIEDAKVAILAVKPEPLDDKLTELCLVRGIVVSEEDTNEIADRLIKAYDKGATDSLNSLPAVKKRPRKVTPMLAPA